MKVTHEKEITINLRLNEKEAIWLRRYFQNFYSGVDETPECHSMRKNLFDCLTDELQKAGINPN